MTCTWGSAYIELINKLTVLTLELQSAAVKAASKYSQCYGQIVGQLC